MWPVKSLYPNKYGKALQQNDYEHALYFEKAKVPGKRRKRGDDGIEREIDKVKVAKIVSEQPANLEILDLKKQVGSLVDLIRQANL
jgi:hypothetical protein